MTMVADTHLREVDACLSAWLRRLRLRDSVRWAMRGLSVGLTAALSLSLFARLVPWQPLPVLIGLSAVLVLVGAMLGLTIAYFWPRPRLAAARYFDRILGLAERTSAALELAQQPGLAPDWLVREQWA
ncbi:MAG: hypothetical protein NZM11_09135, partial [Anaerolineales bacterium]|nr:hypothetical protein [Anaerolineales bacterium]